MGGSCAFFRVGGQNVFCVRWCSGVVVGCLFYDILLRLSVVGYNGVYDFTCYEIGWQTKENQVWRFNYEIRQLGIEFRYKNSCKGQIEI